jgi:hypothetical protein
MNFEIQLSPALHQIYRHAVRALDPQHDADEHGGIEKTLIAELKKRLY